MNFLQSQYPAIAMPLIPGFRISENCWDSM